MSTSGNVRRPSRRRHTLIATAVVGVLVAVALLTLGVASGRPVAQHGSGDASAAKSAMSSTHQLSRAQGHAAQTSRATSGNAAHSSSSSSGSTSSLFNSSILPNLAPNRSLAATGCGIDGTNFEDADGNLTEETCLDWNSFAPVTWLPANAAPYQDATTTNGDFTFFGATDAVNDSTDTSYAGGQKQAFDCPLTGTGSVDNKTDLARIYVAETTAADGHQILYLAWVRGPLNNTSSDVHVGFEFNQGSDLCPVQTSAPFVHRTDGDILLVYNFTQGGTPTLAFATWQNGAWTTEATLDPGIAEAAIWDGDGSTPDALKPTGAPDPDTQEFGEGGVDLTAALAELGTGEKDCAKFGHVFGESRTSGSSTSAQMKDLVGAKIDISTCVEPTVTTTLKDAATNDTIDNDSHVGLGTSVYDTATFGNLTTGKTPTGTVQYTFFTNGACTGTGTDAGLKTVDGTGNIPQSNTEGPLTPGSYSFEAQYLSDDDPNYVDSEVSGCEPFTVDKASLGINTTVHSDSPDQALVGNLPLNGGAHDSATVTGKVGFDLPDVTFYFFPKGVACTNGSTTGATQLNTLTPNQTTGIAHPSTSETGLAAGTYNFMAVVAGDTNYTGATSNCEPFTVDKASLGINTTVHSDSPDQALVGNLPLNGGAHDSATVTGKVGFDLPDVTFYFFPKGVACTNGSTTGATQLNTLTPNQTTGIAHPSTSETGLAAGTYNFMAVVAGDTNYTGATSNCEPFTVDKASLGINTTVHSDSPDQALVGNLPLNGGAHDSATVTGKVGFDLPDVTFYFFPKGVACTNGSTTGATQLNTLTPNQTTGIAHPSTSETGLAAGTYNFMAVVAGDTNYTGATSNCEPFTVDKASLGINTTVHSDSPDQALVGNLPLNGGAHDSATVTGKVGFDLPDVTFYFFPKGVACTNGSTTGATQLNTLTPNQTTGIAHPSTSETGLAAGTYNFMAVVAGDTNYTGATSNCEPFTVDKASLGINTTVHSDSPDQALVGNLPLNGGAHDSATVTGKVGFDLPDVTFYFFPKGVACTNGSTTGATQLNTLTPNQTTGIAHPSTSETGLAAGTYNFMAVVAGDTNYTGATSNCEPFTVDKASLGINTTVHSDSPDQALVGNLPLNGGAHDSATVTGKVGFDLPDVTFYFFPKGVACTNGSTTGATQLNTLTPNQTTGIAHPSTSETGLAAGTYNFMAVVAGDTNYTGATSNCEPFTVDKASLGINTTVHSDSPDQALVGNLPLNGGAHDSATVTGKVGFDLPDVTFYFFPKGVACTNGSTTGATQLNTLTPNQTTGIAHPSTSETGLAAGTYNFMAVVAGDTNYTGATSNCEPFTVDKAQPGVSTTVFDAATNEAWTGTETTGAKAYDTATITGTNGFAPTGTVTYTFFTNGTCSGDGTDAGTVTVNADGSVPNSTTTGSLGAGTYSFRATYSGDSNYLDATGDCEPFSLGVPETQTSTTVFDAATDAAWTGTEKTGASAYDTASVSGQVDGIVPTGTVDYTFFTNGDCSGEGSAAGSVTLDQQGKVPNSDTTDPLQAGDYSFQATYSGDDNYATSTGDCEPFSVAKGDSSTSTTVFDAATDAAWSGTEKTGASAYDTASVTPSDGFTASGTVDYTFFTNGDCSGEGSAAGSVTLDQQGKVPNWTRRARWRPATTASRRPTPVTTTTRARPATVSRSASPRVTRRPRRRCSTRPPTRPGRGRRRRVRRPMTLLRSRPPMASPPAARWTTRSSPTATAPVRVPPRAP